MYLNKINKFIVCVKCAQKRFYSVTTIQEKLFTNIFGLEEKEAKYYVRKNKLTSIDSNRLYETLTFFNTAPIKKDDLLDNPKIFRLGVKNTWEQIYMYLEECGIHEASVCVLLEVRKIRALTIRNLKDKLLIDEHVNVPKKLISYLHPIPRKFYIKDLMNEDLTLVEIHRTIVQRYIAYRLKASEDDIAKLFRTHLQIHNKSLRFLCDNINLALDMGYSEKRILNNGYILEKYPRNTREVLDVLPKFAGCDMRAQMKIYPKLIGISLQNILQIYDILRKNGISDEIISHNMNVFSLSSDTVSNRIKAIKKDPEMRLMMNHPNMLGMIIHFNKAKTRINILHKIKLKCTSLIVISKPDSIFNNYVKEGKDVNRRREVDTLIRSLVKANNDQVEKDMRKHPFYLNVPFIEIEKTYLYLKGHSFLNNQIAEAIQILLYPKEKIGEALEKIYSDERIMAKLKRVKKGQLLNTALYLLEREHHFTGNGIWKSADDDN